MADAPRDLRDPPTLASRLARLDEPHIRPLTELVKRIRHETQDPTGVPWFDPESGGIKSRVLVLLEAPGPKAVGTGVRRSGSGIISIDNDDQSAENCWRLRNEAGLSSEMAVHWNIVPWYIGDGERIRAARMSDIIAAQPYLSELISLLPDLNAVVTMGRKAETGWQRYVDQNPIDIAHFPCPHPSPRVLNTDPAAEGQIRYAFRAGRDMATLGDFEGPPTQPVPTTGQLLADYRNILAELRRREVLRTNNAPTGDYAEYLVARAFDGELAPNSEKSWDVATSDGRRIQVKARISPVGSGAGTRQLSVIRTWGFDELAIILFDDDYGIHRGSLVPVALARDRARYVKHVNGYRVLANNALLDEESVTDITDLLRTTAQTL